MISFAKMQGLGNDYVYIMLENDKNINLPEFAKKISNRNFGIGSDGLITIFKNKNGIYKMRIFNSDGSEANMCGNGIRCVAKYLYDYRYINIKNFEIDTNSGIKKVEVFTNKYNMVEEVKVNMGIAKIMGKKDIVLEYEELVMYLVNIGNNHGVIVVKDSPDFYAKKFGKIISEKYDINIEFVKVLNNNEIEMSVYERGSGITLACGTGACASYFVCLKNGYLKKENGIVNLKGGKLKIDIAKDIIYMQGEAVKVFDGVYYNL